MLAAELLACDPDLADPSATIEDVTLPDLAYCDPVRSWRDDDLVAEAELLAILESVRDEGRSCGARGQFPSAPPLEVSGPLTCAARVHSLDMVEHDLVGHDGHDGTTPWDRMRAAGYVYSNADELVAAATLPVGAVVHELWLSRAGSCAALMAREFVEIGLARRLGDPPGGAEPPRARFTVLVATPYAR